jgi:hypothetical protein
MAADKNLYASAFLLGMSAYSLKASIHPDSMASFPSPVSVHPSLTMSFRKNSTSRSGSHPKSSQAFPTAPTSSVKSSLEPPATHASSSAGPKSVRV